MSLIQNPSVDGFEAKYVSHEEIQNIGAIPVLADRSRLARMSPERRKQHLSGITALGILVNAADGDIAEIRPDEGGCLFREGALILHWSISHTAHGAVAVKSNGPSRIGVDMEPMSRTVTQGALDQILGADLQLKSPYSTKLETWMVIEAISKALGHGLSISREVRYSDGWELRGLSWRVDFEQRRVGGQPHHVCVARQIMEGP